MSEFRPPHPREIIFFQCHDDEISERPSPLTSSGLRVGHLVGPKHGFSGSNGISILVSGVLSTDPLDSGKTVFLITIISARRVGVLQALMAGSPYTQFSKDKVTLQPHPKFLSKVSFSFKPVSLFFPKPHSSSWEQRLHTLNVRQCLAFYLNRT